MLPRAALLLALAGCVSTPDERAFDVVLRGGRVLDPESGLDAVRDVGLSGGKIRAVAPGGLRGRVEIDARGLAVAPGFIDLHQHAHDPEAYALKALDGVTSALELEIGTDDVDRWYAEREGRALIHHGVSIGHPPVRMAVLGDPVEFLPPADSRANRKAATEAEIAEIRRRIERGLRRGAPAVGFGLQYTSAASREEVLEAFRAAAAFGASCHVHLRHGGTKEPDTCVKGLEEVLEAGARSGAPLHVVHLHSSSVSWTPRPPRGASTSPPSATPTRRA